MRSFCKIRDVYRAIIDFENKMEDAHLFSLIEGLLFCFLENNYILASSKIAEQLNLTCSNTSKVIKSVEEKGYIVRALGDKDKRSMIFSITLKGKEKLREVEDTDINIPQILNSFIK